jgi:hypothetical protein
MVRPHRQQYRLAVAASHSAIVYPMTTFLDRVPAEEITARGHAARPGRALATLILGFFFLLGWLPGKLWYGLADCVIAVSIGFRQGAGWPQPPPKAPNPGPPAA